MLGRNRHHPLQPQLPKIIHALFGIASIDFVDEQERAIRRRAKVLCDVAIFGHDARRAVDDKEDEVGFVERATRLRADLAGVGRHRRVAVLQSAGVGELETPSVVESDDVGESIARHAGKVMRESAALPGKAIE